MDTNAENDAADRTKFESFKLGHSTNNMKSNHRHARSRNLSVSTSLSSLSLSFSTVPVHAQQDSLPPIVSSVPSSVLSAAPKRNSHHRRRSSVSTRHESADMMGVAVADLPLSLSDDNINLGDRDSVRRRALWALEGKPDHSSLSKVEIPDIGTPEINKRFEILYKPSFPQAPIGSGFGGLNNVAGKRDSFGKHLPSSTSAMEHLHTLVEEDEEEDDKEGESKDIVLSPVNSAPRVPVVSVPTPPRHRPASLNLRPLSLNKENIIGPGSLPTPSSPSSKTGLRSLTLAPPPNSRLYTTNSDTDNFVTTTKTNRRQSLASSSSSSSSRRTSLTLDFETNFGTAASPAAELAKQRASISYRTSPDMAYGQFALPTPESTPILQSRYSVSSSSSGTSERSMSETEQHFLYHAHTTLVQRITDLERALAVSRARPWQIPYPSDAQFQSSSSLDNAPLEEPSDEMLQLIADLKAERDELNKDVEGWRVRVSDLNKQVSVLAKRVDMERREAWVARERSGLLEIEKKNLEKNLDAKKVDVENALQKYEAARAECDETKRQYSKLKAELQKKKDIQDECEWLRFALADERKKREVLEKTLEGDGLLDTPTPGTFAVHMTDRPPSYTRSIVPRGLGFQSMDSEGTDVELPDEFQISLKSVAEEHEVFSDEEVNELSKYEDEDEGDITFQSNHGSSISSFEDGTRPSPYRIHIPTPPVLSVNINAPQAAKGASGHAHSNSLINTWTFPKGPLASPFTVREAEVDKFFGCLEDSDDSDIVDDGTQIIVSSDNRRSLFSQSLSQSDDDEFPPFLLPSNIGYEIPEGKPVLEVVLEEDEESEQEEKDAACDDEFVGEVVEGGIIFKFTPPDDSDSSSELLTPSPGPVQQIPQAVVTSEEDEDENCVLFPFPEMSTPITPPQKSSDRKTKCPSPSSIPRAVALKTYRPIKSTPAAHAGAPQNSFGAFRTPPTKRGGVMPTFIPDPRRYPTASPMKSQTSRPSAPVFVRQPQQSNLPASTKHVLDSSPVSATPTNARSTSHRYNDHDASVIVDVPSPVAPAVQPPSNVVKMTLQSFTNLIPSAFSWSSRSAIEQDSGGNTGKQESKTCFVSKEKQLEKLRSRLEKEQRKYAVNDIRLCWKCDEELVNL